MVLVLSAQQLAKITAHAERVYPEECCGLMLGKIETTSEEPLKTMVEVAPLENHWTEGTGTEDADTRSETAAVPVDNAEPTYTKHRRYSIAPKDMLRVQKYARAKALSIIGVYHSHPDHVAEPSECDRAQAWPEYAYVIVSVHGKENGAKAVDVQNWALDLSHQFQPEAIKVSPSSAKDRMPVSA
ncbi:MAG: M67 family metallopeptidase [Cyanobacteria bacterium J06597_16]